MKNTTARFSVRARLAAATALVMIALMLGLTGCSTASGTSSAAPTLGSSAAAQWGACMRDKGFAVEDPTPAEFEKHMFKIPSGADSDGFGEASSSCLGEGSGANAGGVSDADQARYAQQVRDFAQCMRDEGVSDFPDPVREGVTDYSQYSPEQQEAPTFQKAHEVCAEKHLQGWQTQEY